MTALLTFYVPGVYFLTDFARFLVNSSNMLVDINYTNYVYSDKDGSDVRFCSGEFVGRNDVSSRDRNGLRGSIVQD